jgi:hypothetical protein
MSEVIYLVQGDTKPQIKVTLKRDDDTAQDVTGATIKLHFRPVNTTTVSFSKTGVFTGVDATKGEVVFNFSSGDLDLDPGDYEGEVEVVYTDSTRETVYEVIQFILREDFA